tara:strand:+ start:671 stop:1003 length:333 start_codon:yes stop_codon:yes gene_type:complete
MDITFIAIAIFLFVAIAFLTLFLFKSINKKSFVADDGSVFDSKKDLDIYVSLYDKTKPLFSPDDDKNSPQQILGFEKSFISKLTSDAFPDLKTLVKYRQQFKSLSDLINN